MTKTFDTLGYAKRLMDAGISFEHAAAHAEAFRDYVVPLLPEDPRQPATKADFHELVGSMNRRVAAISAIGFIATIAGILLFAFSLKSM